MATDGVKIIDGDLAFDTYAIFYDTYNAGADGAALRKAYQQEKEQYAFDEFSYEIYVTVYALALWEIGELTPEILSEVEAVIAKGAGVADWSEEIDEQAGKARRKELDKLLAKISKPNTKIKKRKKYEKIESLIFQPGDVLTFRMPDGSYGLTVVVDNMQYRGECDYMLCRTSFNSNEKPTMDSLANLRIYGSHVPTGGGFDMDLITKMQSLTADEMAAGALNNIMAEFTAKAPKLKMPWAMVIQHKKLMTEDYRNNFEKIGEVELRSNCGSSRFAPTYADFCEGFYPSDSELGYERQHFGVPKMGEFTVEELQLQPYQKEK